MLRHLALALRTLRRAPTFSLVAIGTLALAIGSTTAIFSVVDAVVLHGLPYGDANQLRAIYERSDDGQFRVPSFPTFTDWQRASTDDARVIEGLAFVRGDGLVVGDSPERQIDAFVTPGFFQLMKVRPFLGRTFRPDEEQPGAARVAVLSYDFFVHRFGGDPSVVGTLVAFDSVPTTMIGVMPRAFAFPNFGGGGWLPPAAWQPIAVFQATNPAPLTRRELHVDSRALVRLRPGVDSARATAAMHTIAQRLGSEYPKEQAHWTSVAIRTLSQELFGDLWSTLGLVSGAVGLVLLLACANVASLMLIRSSVRGQEFAVRAALGAGRWRLARQPFIEAIVIAFSGALLGILLAAGLVAVMRPFAQQRLPLADHIALDPRALAFALGVTVLTTLLIGGLSALEVGRADLNDRLRGGAAGRGRVADARARHALVSLQFALAITLLVGAGLLIQSVRRLTSVALGYDPNGIVSFAISPPAHRYSQPAQAAALYKRILDAVRAVPSVQNAAAAGGALLQTKVEVADRPETTTPTLALYHPVSAEYFHTLHVSIARGRGFTDDDMRDPVGLLVSDTLARQLWPRSDAIGQRITIYRQSQARADIGQPITLPVVGVVSDYHEFGPTGGSPAEVFLPYTLEVWPWMNFVVRAGRSPSVLVSIEQAIKSTEPAATFFGKPSFDNAGRTPPLSDPRMFVTALLSGFAATALLLAAVGLYGVVAYAVTQRMREIGIRLAIGATHGHIVLLLLRRASVFVLVGIGSGMIVALGAVRLLRSLLFQTAATDVTTFVVVPLVLAVVAFAASCIPAIRAARTDPSIVMKAE